MATLNKTYILLLITSLAAFVQNSEANFTVYPTVNCIIDYSVYESLNNNEREIEKEFSYIWNNVIALYRKIPAPKIEIVYRGCKILKEPNAVHMSDILDASLDVGSRMINASLAITNFGKYLSSQKIPVDKQANINIFFTDYKLCLKNCGLSNINTVGLANVASACLNIPNAVGIIKVQKPHDTVHTVAHELAHMLGAPHDGDGGANDCDSEDFIMGPRHLTDDNSDSTPNPLAEYQWSSCTVKMIHDFITKGKGYCLKKQSNVNYGDGEIDFGVEETDDDYDNIYKPEVKKLEPTEPPIEPRPPSTENDDNVQPKIRNTFSFDGAFLQIDNECKQKGYLGVCADEYRDKNICKPVVCEYQHSSFEKKCETIDSQVARNTPCGNDKVCLYGYCVDADISNESPDFDINKSLPPLKKKNDDDIHKTRVEEIKPEKPSVNPTPPSKKNDDDVQTRFGNEFSYDKALLDIDNECKQKGNLGICTPRYYDKNICKPMECEHLKRRRTRCRAIDHQFADNSPCGYNKVCSDGHCRDIKVSKKSPDVDIDIIKVLPPSPPKKNDDNVQTRIKNKVKSDITWMGIDYECKKNSTLGICAAEYEDENPCKPVVCEYQHSLFEKKCKIIELQLNDDTSCGDNKICSHDKCVDVGVSNKTPDFVSGVNKPLPPLERNDDDGIFKTTENIKPKNPLFNPTPPPKKNDDDVQTTDGSEFSYFDWLSKIHEECRTNGALGICYSQYFDNNTCKPILCEFSHKHHERICKTIGRQYSKNTPCGDNKVCLNGICVDMKVPSELPNWGDTIKKYTDGIISIGKGFKDHMDSVKKNKNINEDDCNSDSYHSISDNENEESEEDEIEHFNIDEPYTPNHDYNGAEKRKTVDITDLY